MDKIEYWDAMDGILPYASFISKEMNIKKPFSLPMKRNDGKFPIRYFYPLTEKSSELILFMEVYYKPRELAKIYHYNKSLYKIVIMKHAGIIKSFDTEEEYQNYDLLG